MVYRTGALPNYNVMTIYNPLDLLMRCELVVDQLFFDQLDKIVARWS